MKLSTTMRALGMNVGDVEAVVQHLLERPKNQLVTQGSWGVSFTTGDGMDGAVLNVYRFPRGGTSGPILKGDGDGRLFASVAHAKVWAFEHGYLVPHFTRAACSHCRGVHGYWCEATGQLRSDARRVG